MATKNLMGKEAIEKLKKLAEDARVCMMTTNIGKVPSPSRPMYLHEVDENGKLWFISSKESDKNQQIASNAEVQLYFMNGGDSEYLSIFGEAIIYTDQKTIDAHWSPMANAWFDGKEDNNVSILCVEPIDVKYWDTKYGKFFDMATMLYSAVTGDRSVNGGVSGTITI